MANKFGAVLTAKQERQAGVSNASIWYTSGNSGKDLWKLKANNPELFAKKAKQAGLDPDIVPPGFEETEKAGWYYNRADKIFFVTLTKKFLWFDEESGEHKELYEGEALPLTFGGGAASLAEANGAKAGPKTVVIPDLHRVASALKVDLSHVDKPAAMLGVFTGEMAARSFHEKLVKRLGLNRSRWLDHQLASAMEKVLQEVSSESIQVSVIAIFGGRACGVATPEAAFRLSLRPTQAGGLLKPTATAVPTASSRSRCLVLKAGDELFAAATVGGSARQNLEEDFEKVLAPQLMKGWARAGAIALLSARKRAAEPLAVACARLLPDLSDALDLPPAKRPKVDLTSPIFTVGTSGTSGGGGKADQVRLRQILLRTAGTGPPVMDPIRRRQVKRTQEEAESEMFDILQSLEADGFKNFQKVCRNMSECPSALKGGDLVGDMGWLDRVKGVGIQQDKAKQGVRPQVPAAVQKAAFQLAVGEVHDLVTTDVGVHLLQRTA